MAVLELEVSHYLLTLRGKRLDSSTRHESECFSIDNRLKSLYLVKREPESPSLRCGQENLATEPRSFSFDNRLKEPGSAARQFNQENSTTDSSCFSFVNRLSDQCFYEEEDIDSCVRRCLSSYIQNGSKTASLAEHMGTKISGHIVMTSNKLSEEMIKCASTIYSKLADPPSINHGFSSPSSSPSSTSEFSPQEQYDMWSPSFRKNFDDQFESSGPYSSMIEVSHIYRNHRKGRDLDLVNRNFSLIIKKLESVDPSKLSHQEKLVVGIVKSIVQFFIV